MNKLEEKLCGVCNSPMQLANSMDCDSHYKHIYICKECFGSKKLTNKVIVEAKDRDLTLAELDHITREVEDINNNIETILKKDILPKRTFRELNCFNSREFEKGIEEVGIFYVTDSLYGLELGLGVESQFQNVFHKNQIEIARYLEEEDINNKLKDCVKPELLNYAGLDNLTLVRFGIRKNNYNLVIDVNKPMVKQDNLDKIGRQMQNIIAPLVDILFS